MTKPNIFSQGSVKDASRSESKITYQVPAFEDAIVCKFIVNPHDGTSHVPILYWKHRTGPNESDVSYHPDAQSLGKGESPERNELSRIRSQMAAMKREGAQESEEYEVLKQLNKTFSPREGGYLYYVEPNSPDIKALKISKMILNRLFGRDGSKNIKAIPSLLQEMKKKGHSPYVSGDPAKDTVGWVKIWKTGEKLSTEYHVEVDTITVVENDDGEMVEKTKHRKHQLHEKIASGDVTFDDFPPVLEVEANYNLWTFEESSKYVESHGLYTPERVLNENKVSDSEIKDVNAVEPPALPSLDGIPF